MSFSNVGKVWTVESFKEHLNGTKKPAFANSITIHHTGAPTLIQRPHGFLIQHIHNMQTYYKSLGWSRGPHLFVDEDQIFGMTPLTTPGIHAVSFNRSSIGIEILGNYDVEDPTTGRGLDCIKNAAMVSRLLCNWLDIPINEKTVLFHRDDPKTTKTCPGKRITKEDFLKLIRAAIPASKPAEQLFALSENKVAVIDYATKHKGYTYDEAVRLLKNKSGLFYFNGVWLESASYDSKLRTTVAFPGECNKNIPIKRKL
jgi:N-acetylmuramoyl-L-alanine amidase CwlA